jgi:hypothetical protein
VICNVYLLKFLVNFVALLVIIIQSLYDVLHIYLCIEMILLSDKMELIIIYILLVVLTLVCAFKCA